MTITFIQTIGRQTLELYAEGDVFYFNGRALDLSGLSEGDELDSMDSGAHEWVKSTITRVDGEITMDIRYPHLVRKDEDGNPVTPPSPVIHDGRPSKTDSPFSPNMGRKVSSSRKLRQNRRAAKLALVAYINDTMDIILAQYPRAEIQSWSLKVLEARVISSGGAATTLSQSEVEVTGETEEQWADNILTKAGTFEIISATMSGLRRVWGQSFTSSSTLPEIAQVLQDAKAAVDAAAASMNLQNYDPDSNQ